ncbi:hypothetical protein HU200_029299 [Digitaria exilis]|uniref:F-box domain-containing protein n=1 Tax=Digitaria exilis TaxID=1010633 RepID=A0A835BU52_9POAL|nr:hypothetical protein HU200_029299 [Digitaria exilis]
MPPREPAKRAVPPVGGSGSSIEVLPDSVLEHILGFLPSPEAVQTSVLARRWRHLWKSATGLNVGCGSVPISVEELRSLMNHLLILRQGSPLEKCKLEFDGYSGHDDVPHVNLWFRQTRLELDGVRVHSSLLNFSHCPALEYLAINESNLTSVNKIVSESLKHLTIYDTACSYDSRIHIYAPKMVSLRIDYPRERTPMLEKMPELVQGFVRINDECTDRCNGPNYETCDCKSCDTSDNMADGCRNNCVLLNGVSEAQNLALISVSEMLKILLLNDYWCVPDDFWALACILQHSPVLEKLTLQLFSEGPEPKVLMKLRVDPTKRSGAISKNLKKVELKREVVDVRVLKVLKFLSTFNICKLTCNAPVLLAFTECLLSKLSLEVIYLYCYLINQRKKQI